MYEDRHDLTEGHMTLDELFADWAKIYEETKP